MHFLSVCLSAAALSLLFAFVLMSGLMSALGLFTLIAGVLYLAAATGLWARRDWSWILALTAALVAMPAATILSFIALLAFLGAWRPIALSLLVLSALVFVGSIRVGRSHTRRNGHR